MREERAGRDVQGVDARLDEPLADLNRLLERVARRAEVERRQRVVLLLVEPASSFALDDLVFCRPNE